MVAAPISLAFAASMFIAVPVASAPSSKDSPISLAFRMMPGRSSSATVPAIACTFDMPASKLEPTLIAAVPMAPTAAAAPERIAVVAFIPFWAISMMPLTPAWKPSVMILVSNFKVPS